MNPAPETRADLDNETAIIYREFEDEELELLLRQVRDDAEEEQAE
jgi:hypothetical protein